MEVNHILLILLSFHLVTFAGDFPPAPDHQIIPAQIGGQVILPCRALCNNISTVKWTTPELVKSGKEEYVLLLRDGHITKRNQHPDFDGRVRLVDRHLKNGNLSIFLQNVTFNDSGMYICQYKDSEGTEGNCTVSLEVKEEPVDGAWWKVLVGILIGVVLLIAGVILYLKKCKEQQIDPESASENNCLNTGGGIQLVSLMTQRPEPESGPYDPEKASLNTGNDSGVSMS